MRRVEERSSVVAVSMRRRVWLPRFVIRVPMASGSIARISAITSSATPASRNPQRLRIRQWYPVQRRPPSLVVLTTRSCSAPRPRTQVERYPLRRRSPHDLASRKHRGLGARWTHGIRTEDCDCGHGDGCDSHRLTIVTNPATPAPWRRSKRRRRLKSRRRCAALRCGRGGEPRRRQRRPS